MSTQRVVDDIVLSFKNIIQQKNWKKFSPEVENFADLLAEAIVRENKNVINIETIVKMRGLADSLRTLCMVQNPAESILRSCGELRALVSVLTHAHEHMKVLP